MARHATFLLLSLFFFPVSYSVGQSTSAQRLGAFSRPVFATSPAGDNDRLFVLEQHTGNIRIFDLNTNSITGTFLTVPGLATGNEQGLLGMAFDPDYATNGYFYVNITTSAGGGDTAIRRYSVSDTNPNLADPSSGVDLLVFNQPQSNHNGGWIGFGPNDGYLYIASGDGGGGDDNDSGHTAGIGNAQDITNNLLGKMLRIAPSTDEVPAVGYTVPASNPFVGVTGDDEIWSFGLRNPYRASFDRATGDLWIGDVGQQVREEIDFQPADSPGGENYGWRLREGTIATPSGGVGGPPPAGNVEPIYDYLHGGGTFQGNVVIGGYVYRGPVERFQGHYIFADAGSNNIWSLDPEAVDPAASVAQINSLLAPSSSSIIAISSFAEDNAGNLYMMDLSGGDLFRIETSAQDAVWNGDDASAGTAGDGTSWTDANNWTRGGVVDTGVVEEDNIVFAPPSPATVALENRNARRAAAVTFQNDTTLTGSSFRVLSGNITVDEGVVATIDVHLLAETSTRSLRKLGSGTLIVDEDADQLVVKQGTVGGSGSIEHLTVESGGTVAPGTLAGILNIESSFTLEQGSTLAMELGGTDNSDPGNPEYDQLLVGGAASLAGGDLVVSLINGFEPKAGDSFAILSANGGFDDFANTTLPDLNPGLEWLVNPGGITISLQVEVTLPGDYNNDGSVDAADYVVWRNNLGSSVELPGDETPDGVTVEDYTVWKNNFGATAAGALVRAKVPEPSGLLVLLTLLAIPLALKGIGQSLQF